MLPPELRSVVAELEGATDSRGALFVVRETAAPWRIEWARGPDLLFGHDAGTLVDQPESWWHAVHVSDRERVERDFETEAAHRVLEYRVTRPAADTRWLRESMRRVEVPGGRDRWVSVVRDVTVERGADRPDPAVPSAGIDPKASAGQGTVVLLVEDDDAVRAVLARVLAREGFSLLLAATAGEALRIFEKAPRVPEVLVCDVILPDRPGPELARAILRRRPELPVLFMSGYGHDELERRSDEALGHPLLPKPFTPSDLVRSVRAALTARRQTGGSGVMSGPESAAS